MTDQGDAEPAPSLPGVLASKVRAPRVRAGALERRALLDRLAVSGARLVLLHGPAGAGKTTLARQWVATDRRPAAWLTVDRGDDDPVRLVRHVVAAVDVATPAPGAVAAAAVPHPSVDAEVLPALDLALAGGPDRIVVLDDVHELGSDDALSVLGQLAGLVPAGSTLVVSARSLPGTGWARHLADGDTLELGFTDLAFDAGESAEVVRRGLPAADPVLVSALVERAQGWPAALQLTVLAVRGGSDGGRPAEHLSAGDGAVLDYFHQEVLAGLRHDDRELLVRTSVLEELCGPLCDELLGCAGSGARLERLASSENLFVVGLDDDGVWYRNHALFRQLLLSELRSKAPADEVPLRVLGATWLSDSGHADAAVRQALAAGQLDLAGRVALHHLVGCVNTGQVGSVEGWLAAAGAPAVASSPALTLCAAWVAFLQGRGEGFWHRLEQLGDRAPAGAGAAAHDFARARDALLVVSGSGGTKETHRAAANLVALGQEGNPWWASACLLEAVTGHLLGELPDPRERLALAIAASEPGSTSRVVGRAQLALAELRLGDREAAQRWALAARRELDDAGLADYPLGAMVWAGAALVGAQLGRDDWRRDSDRCRQLLRALSGSLPRAQAQIRLTLSEAALVGNDVPQARHLLEEAAAFLDHEPDAVVLHADANDLRERVHSRTSSRGGLVADLTDAEVRVLEQLATHLTLVEIGGVLYVSRNTVKSHTIAIYRKLGVSGRSAAVGQARNMGLLDR